MFSCSRSSKVKEARGRRAKTLTEQHKAELRARRKEEATQRSQRQAISSTESLTSEGEETAKGLYVYKLVDESRRVSTTVHSTRPPQRAKSLEACRPPPLVLASA